MSHAARKPLSSIRPVRLDLWTDGFMIGRAQIVCDDGPMPEVVMVDGLPFVPDASLGTTAYRRVRPCCIAMER